MRWREWWRQAAGQSSEPATEEESFARARERMVRQQLEGRGLRDPELLRAFRTVPRHLFVESQDAYGDRALAIPAGQTISQPYVVAAMAEIARPARGYDGARVLEVGTGSGYSAAILAEMGAQVTSVERHRSLAEEAEARLRQAGYGRVQVVVGDGSLGWPDNQPFDAIIVTAAGPGVPQPLLEQLSVDGGRLVMPVGTRNQQWLTLVERHGEAINQREVEPVVFVPLVGEHGFHE
jgi:protein-L-isoaspartate(D-aspartate) O-methyltransferase